MQNFSFGYDNIGRLISRADANTGLSEEFIYDTLDRLLRSRVKSRPARVFTYSATGNILSKTGVGDYTYPKVGEPRPHAVTRIDGALTTTFSYDPNGNQITGAGLSISYTAFNQPASISRATPQGPVTLDFRYGPERQRYEQVGPDGTTLTLADPMGSGVMAEQVTAPGGAVRWNNYLFAGGELIGMRVDHAGGNSYFRYFHKDHLGSISVITGPIATVVERLSYDAWGMRRNPDGSDAPPGSITSDTTRGFTGHEELDKVGLIHMNARVYDPMLGRFSSAESPASRFRRGARSSGYQQSLGGWAWSPGSGRRPAPGTQKEAGALVEAWVKTGAACPN